MQIIYVPPSLSETISSKVLPVIHDGSLAVSLIGLAVLLIYVLIKIFKWLLLALGWSNKKSDLKKTSIETKTAGPSRAGLGKSVGVQVDLKKFKS